MNLYRIQPDRLHYRLFAISTEEILNKLGESYPFHIDPSPKSYADVWKSLEISFYDSTDNNTANKQPDLTIDSGRLFLNSRAYEALHDLLQPHGEFLPVHHAGGKGFIFNPLVLAEQVGGLNQKLSTKNAYGDLQSLGFYQNKVKDFPVFRTEFDQYIGLYCTELFKTLTEKETLHGITFSTDLGNTFPADPSAQEPTSH